MSKKVVLFQGHPIDVDCKYQDAALYIKDNVVYSCTLNQTDIETNKNKYYIMQLLVVSGKYIIFTKYGRISTTEKGKCNYEEYSSENEATFDFIKTFKSKTGNKFPISQRDFIKKSGKYYLTETTIEEPVKKDDKVEIKVEEEVKSKLDPEIKEFIELISDTKLMNNTMAELEINLEKMPLGNISKTQVENAYKILNKIANNTDNDDIVALSSEFYTLFPIDFKRKKPLCINSKELLAKYMNMLNEVSNMVITTTIIKSVSNIDSIYDRLNTKISVLKSDTNMYKVLKNYIYSSLASTHHFKFDIHSIYGLTRENEEKNYKEFSKDIGNKTLLFHGTRLTNLVGILSTNLLCDPSKLGMNVHVSGKLFGNGLYFADSFSKSLQYCDPRNAKKTCCLFVTEVALGNLYKTEDWDYKQKLDKQYQSTHGLGSSGFSEFKKLEEIIENCDENMKEIRIPYGKFEKYKDSRSLLYNEYIIYNDPQCTLRYVVRLNMK